jgi:Skp family chaperone for outer membrane proteins
MNRLMLPVLLAVLLLPVCSSAQAPADSFPTAKIAWINLEQVVFTCDEGKAKFSEIQAFVDEKNKENDKLRAELDKLRNQLQVQGSKLTDEARADLEEQIEKKKPACSAFSRIRRKRSKTAACAPPTTSGNSCRMCLKRLRRTRESMRSFSSTRRGMPMSTDRSIFPKKL